MHVPGSRPRWPTADCQKAHWERVEPDEFGRKKTRISVFFESFVRSTDSARLADKVAELSAMVELQQRRIELLEAQQRTNR